MDNMFDDPAEDEKYAQRPDSLKKLRACKTCKLIKTRDQFYSSFCDNCLHSRPQENPNQNMREYFVEQETTADFEGMVSMLQPHTSWVARWLRMRRVDEDGNQILLKPGLYAIALPGEEAAAAAAGRGRGIAEEEEGDGDAAFEPDEGEENEATLDDEAADDDDEDDDAKKGGSGGAGAGGRRAASSGTSRAAPQRDQDPDAIQAAIESTAIRDDDDYDD